MLTQRTNYHHSKLPQIGAIGYLIEGYGRFGDIRYWFGKRQKFQAIAYPLSDNVIPYSVGIHTAYFRNLKNGQIVKMSGFYFEGAE